MSPGEVDIGWLDCWLLCGVTRPLQPSPVISCEVISCHYTSCGLGHASASTFAVEKSYDRDALTSDIVRHGGMVVGSPLEVGGDMDGVFCVSDGPCRKRKFLLALAVGLPCVSFQFVLECVKQVRPLPTGAVSPLCCCWCRVTSVLFLVWCHLCVVAGVVSPLCCCWCGVTCVCCYWCGVTSVCCHCNIILLSRNAW